MNRCKDCLRFEGVGWRSPNNPNWEACPRFEPKTRRCGECHKIAECNSKPDDQACAGFSRMEGKDESNAKAD